MAVKLGTEAVTGNLHPLIGSQFGHIMLAKLSKRLDYPARAPSSSTRRSIGNLKKPAGATIACVKERHAGIIGSR